MCVLLLLVLLLAAACSGKENPPMAITHEVVAPGSAWPALAVIKTGENPLWFELGPNGPALIDSPSAAAMTPYVPWPHAVYITGIQTWEGSLVMAVNKDGFLILETGLEATELVLYRVADSALWNQYTAESFFIWESKPAVLLYRNDFFSEPKAPPLKSQVFVLDRSSSIPLALAIPALETSGAWEAEVLRRGPDGFWYYRMKEKGKAKNETAYFRTGDLAIKGEPVSVGDWRNSERHEADWGLNRMDANFEASSLPALPEGFVYSGAAILGSAIAVCWEEQQDAGIGAAGFMVMASNAIITK